jgi:hypothetical protein
VAASNSLRQSRQEVISLTSDMMALNEQAQNIRQNYEAGVQPLHDQLDAINKEYDAQQRLKALTAAQRDVTREQGLAVDVFSSAGQSANAALPGDLQRLQDLQAAQAHQEQVQGIQDEIDRQTSDYRSALSNNTRLRNTTRRQLNDAQNGISIEDRQGEADAASTAAIQREQERYRNVIDNHPSGNPPFLPGPYQDRTLFPAGAYSGGSGAMYPPGAYSGGATNGLGLTYPSMTVNFNVNGVSTSGAPADVEGSVRDLFEKPHMQTWLSQQVFGK